MSDPQPAPSPSTPEPTAVSGAAQPLTPALPAAPSADDPMEQEMDRLTRRSLLTGLVAGSFGFATYSWLNLLAFDKRVDAKLQWPFRRMLQFNQQVSETLLGSSGLAPEFPLQDARTPRTNGKVGLKSVFAPQKWRLRVTQPGTPIREIRIRDIQALPKTEMVTEFKCVEGWSEVVHWGGVRFSEFLTHFGLGRRSGQPWNSGYRPEDLFPYVKLATPDNEYFVGLDMASMLHPQTLLCYEMNGEPLTSEHGAPLRLVITVKYGIKNIKRIGQLWFTEEQPRDYWAERGYDWYAGL